MNYGVLLISYTHVYMTNPHIVKQNQFKISPSIGKQKTKKNIGHSCKLLWSSAAEKKKPGSLKK